jgi:predicted transcriptional regulator
MKPPPPLPVIPHRSRLTGPDRVTFARAAAARYRGGASIRQLAEESGRSYGAVHRLLSTSGVKFRRRGGSRSRP